MIKATAITGIHTGIGKTVVSAVLAEALGADYWKPVQAGDLENSDSLRVRSLIGGGSDIHPEAYRLSTPVSPHAAARMEGMSLDPLGIQLPSTGRHLVVETAGGVLSPFSDTVTMADFVARHRLPALLVTRHYLGSINHTLACIEALRSRDIALKGIVVSGEPDSDSESFIRQYSGCSDMAHVPQLSEITPAVIRLLAAQLKPFFLHVTQESR